MGDCVGMRQAIAEEWTKWRGLISEQAQSGETGAVFCRERGLPVWQFYAWKKRLGEAAGAKFVEVEVKPARGARESWGRDDKVIEVRLSRGLSLFVESGFEASHLRALLSVLESEG